MSFSLQVARSGRGIQALGDRPSHHPHRKARPLRDLDRDSASLVNAALGHHNRRPLNQADSGNIAHHRIDYHLPLINFWAVNATVAIPAPVFARYKSARETN